MFYDFWLLLPLLSEAALNRGFNGSALPAILLSDGSAGSGPTFEKIANE